MTSIPTTYSYNYNNDVNRFKYLEKLDLTPEQHDSSMKASANKYYSRRNHITRLESSSDKLQALIGSVLGTTLTLIAMMRHQKVKNPLKLKYGLKEMIVLSGTPILGGVTVGMIGNNAETNLAKSREGVFQFLNAAIPTWLAGATLRWCETTRGLNNAGAKLISTAATVLIGMHGAASLSNIICDPKDKHPDRKLSLLDSLANIDDLFGVLVLAKFPIVNKLHLDKLLPAIYTFCGYRAGKSN